MGAMNKTTRRAGTAIFAAVMFLFFESAAVRRQAPADKQAPAPVPSLKLELKLDKTEVIRGESVPFELALTNTGSDPIELCDASPKNRAFTIRITGGGRTLTADPMSVAAREGESVEPAPPKPSMKTIAAGEHISVQGDLAAWFGSFGPGDFAVTGSYASPPKLTVSANKIALKVTQAAPLYFQTARQNLFLDQQTRDTAWINRTASGFDLFLLQSSPKNPDVAYSNRPIASLTSAEEPIPCSYNVAAPKVQQVVWASEGNLQIVRIPQNGSPEGPTAVPLPDSDLKPLETPYTGPDGNLHLVLASSDGKAAGLLQVPAEGRPSFIPIETAPPVSGQHSLLWGKDDVFFLAWLSADSKAVFAATAKLSDTPTSFVPRKIFSSALTISDLQLSQRFNQGRQAYDFVLVILGLDRSREALQVRRIDARTGNVEADERFNIPGLKGMTFFKSSLREDLSPVYSFFDSEGGLWVAQPRLGRLTPVSDSTGSPVTKSCYPELVLPSKASRVQGVYVRFIDGGKRIAVVKVG